jgi:hypothetical protein
MRFFFLLFGIIFLSSCDGGLAPTPASDKSFINGTIRYIKGVENWPPQDSVFAIRAAAFKTMPDSNIVLSILSGQAYFTGESLPMFTDSAKFSFEISEAPVNIVYIIVVWQFTTDILSQRVIGVYTISGNKTKNSELYIEKGNSYKINIDVDFDDLPPMPF